MREKEKKEKTRGNRQPHTDHLLIGRLPVDSLDSAPLVLPRAIALALAVGSLANETTLCSIVLWKHSALTQRQGTQRQADLLGALSIVGHRWGP